MLGSTGAENQYIVEGLNTTGVERAEKGKQLNFDFVEEIEVKTGGLPAEYGRATGGVINVITKSGGNTFRGSFFGFNEGGKLQTNDDTADLRPATTTTVADIDKKWDFGLETGGFIVQAIVSGSSARTTTRSSGTEPRSSVRSFRQVAQESAKRSSRMSIATCLPSRSRPSSQKTRP